MSAPDEPEPLLAAALSIADDQAVDWERAFAESPELAGSLENLQALARIALEYRADEGPPEPQAVAFAWGPLRALRLIGEGAFGEVWEAWDPGLQRRVALKLRRTNTAGGPGALPWLGEARRLARVRHAHVLAVHGADVHEGRAGLWTELLEGRTLEAQLAGGGPFSAREATLIGLDLCAALAAVHAAGLAHGDVKATNVMRVGLPAADSRDAGRIVLMDFGAAHAASPSGPGGVGAGTPLASAPEVLAGGPLSPAADLYSLGVLLYRLVSGEYPLSADTLEELLAAHARAEHQPLRSLRPDLPPAFVQVVERALAHDPAHRFRDAAGMESALAATLGDVRDRPAARPSWTHLLGAMAGGALVVGLLWAGTSWIPEWTRPRFHLAPSGAAVASRVRVTLHGSEENGLFGAATASPGDIDGDGIPDLLVSAPGESSACGRVYLYRGRADGAFEPWRRFTGVNELGFSLAAIGDVNGDGVPDFAAGEPYADPHGARSGAVVVYLGDARAGAVPALRLEGPRAEAMFGYAVAGAGDVNHDGYADIVVGAPLDNTGGRDAGRAYVYFGGPHLHPGPDLVLGPGTPGAQFGISVSGIGDFNGDGFDDVAIGANGDRHGGPGAGLAAVYFGGSKPDSTPALELFGSAPGAWFGIAVHGLGDIDGDGFDDLAVGAEHADGYEPMSGTVSVFRGGQHPNALPAHVLFGPRHRSLFGHAIGSGDLNGDGRPDLLVGAYGGNEVGSLAGEVIGYWGGTPLDPVADLRFTGTDAEGNFGTSVCALPGRAAEFASVAVGAPYSGATQTGAVWVFGLSRYAFTRPHAGERWRAGTPVRVAWLGRERAVLEWTTADAQWHELARGVGGREENSLTIQVPATVPGPLRLRLRPADPRAGPAVLSESVEVVPAR